MARFGGGWLVAGILVIALLPAAALAGTDITTYHGDLFRTGWNNTETLLNPSTVAGSSFGLLRTLTLDDQVDAQPLIVSDQPIDGQQTVHDVAYVATEANSVYAFDPSSGEQLLHVNLGPAVPRDMLPGKCLNNADKIGIASTPVIDLAAGTMYVVAYTVENGAPAYRVHALDLRNLKDRVAPQLIKAIVYASPSDPIRFDAGVNRQRAGLALANGNVYAVFASFCDLKTKATRGWVLGWRQDTLKPMPSRPLIDRKAAHADAWFLSSIWMSGAAPAVDGNGRLYVVTGNRVVGNPDPIPRPPGEREMSESVVAVSGDLRMISEYFTPKNRDALDEADLDLGSGGVILLPDQDGPLPHLAAAAGKDGTLYLLDRDHMGGFAPSGEDKAVGKYPIGQCFCASSYFVGPDGVNRLVTSGGHNIVVWKIATSPTVHLDRDSASHPIVSGQFQGFMTTVSSNGSDGAVIWAVAHPPNEGQPTITLHAFDAANATRLFSEPAGTWPNRDGTANVVPVVANGKVFVAGYRSLAIFGLKVPSKNLVSAEPKGSALVQLAEMPAAAPGRLARSGN
jgi:outer membrane protein assembly factor BamB